MSHRNQIIFALGVFGLVFAAFPVSAVMLTPSSAADIRSSEVQDDTNVTAQPTVQTGVISAIDIAKRTIMIERTSYFFVAGLTRVHSKNPLIDGNPLKLKVGQAIEFVTKVEAGGRMRISDVVVK